MTRLLFRRRLALAAAIALSAAMTGCRHKAAPFTIPMGAQTPLMLDDPEAGEQLPAIAELPVPVPVPLPDISTLPTPPRRRAVPPPKEDLPGPVAPPEPNAAELAIGDLSTGGDVAPQIQQQARDMIASILKRIAALSSKTADARKRQIRQVRNFLDLALQAVDSGDAQGAKNLATKASLLMDDLEKK